MSRPPKAFDLTRGNDLSGFGSPLASSSACLALEPPGAYHIKEGGEVMQALPRIL